MKPLLNPFFSIVIGSSVLAIAAYSFRANSQSAPPAQAQAEAALLDLTAAQQTCRARNRRFTNKVNALKRSFTISSVPGYKLTIRTTTRGAYQYAIPTRNGLKAYVSGVWLPEDAPSNSPDTVAVVCEAKEVRKLRPADPYYVRGVLGCAPTTDIKYSTQPNQEENLP